MLWSYEKTPTIEKAKSMKKGFSNLVEVSISGDDDVVGNSMCSKKCS